MGLGTDPCRAAEQRLDLMLKSDDGGAGHGVVLHEGLFHPDRRHVLAVGLDDVFEPVDEDPLP